MEIDLILKISNLSDKDISINLPCKLNLKSNNNNEFK